LVFWGPNLVMCCIFNQSFEHSKLLHKCNSQSGNALGSHWVPSFVHSPICESVFHIQTHFS
jgi:hypothetical protein